MSGSKDTNQHPRLGIGDTGSEARFSQAAIDYVDALLLAQQQLFEARSGGFQPSSHLKATMELSKNSLFFAEDDAFIGGGWSDLVTGTIPFRWMRRVGALLIRTDTSQGATIKISGPKANKRRFLKEISVWLDNHEIKGKITVSIGGKWTFEGLIPPCGQDIHTPYKIIRIRSPRMAKLRKSYDYSHASIAVSSIEIHALNQ